MFKKGLKVFSSEKSFRNGKLLRDAEKNQENYQKPVISCCGRRPMLCRHRMARPKLAIASSTGRCDTIQYVDSTVLRLPNGT